MVLEMSGKQGAKAQNGNNGKNGKEQTASTDKPKKKVALAYSGGLDTTVIIKWLQTKVNADVIAVCVDVGQAEPLADHAARAKAMGAEAIVIDAVDEFAEDYILPALRANLLYEGAYPAGTALARPLICEKMVEAAKAAGATALAHGCTAKGNDQVRFESCFAALAPEMEVIAPMRIWNISRQEEIKFAEANGIALPKIGGGLTYSVDENLWGRSIEGGQMEDPWNEVPEEVYAWTSGTETSPSKPTVTTIGFEHGNPVSIDGEKMSPTDLIKKMNVLAGLHGVGRIDHIEDRVVGIKSREVYEYPAAIALMEAHKALEKLTLPKDVLDFKILAEQQYAQLVYGGKWFSQLKTAIQAFIDELQMPVSGMVKLKMFKGACSVSGMSSQCSMYDAGQATYGKDDAFDHSAADGFLKLYILPIKASAKAGIGGVGSVKFHGWATKKEYKKAAVQAKASTGAGDD